MSDAYRLPAHLAAGPHRDACLAMLVRIAAAWPDAGVGIAGSVVLGTHRPDSDLDLVVVDAAFRRDLQVATEAASVRTGLVCLRAGMDAERERRWRRAVGPDLVVTVLVRMSFVARDPAGVLGSLRASLAALDREHEAGRDALLAARRAEAADLARALRAAPDTEADPHAAVALLQAVLDGWTLRRGLRLHSRRDSDTILARIAVDDPALAAHLGSAVPFAPGAAAALLRAAEHVFGPSA